LSYPLSNLANFSYSSGGRTPQIAVFGQTFIENNKENIIKDSW